MQHETLTPEEDCLPALAYLIQKLEQWGHDIDQEQLVALLGRPILWADVAPFLRFTTESRCRTPLLETPDVEVILIGWLPGQASSLHDHGPSHCVFRVVSGAAQEQRFLSSDMPKPYEERVHLPGELVTVVPGEAHIVANRSAREPLVTLHVYAPPLASAPPRTPLS
ncbi:MAG: cysteine dioxygenase [Myxococcota bacterium]